MDQTERGNQGHRSCSYDLGARQIVEALSDRSFAPVLAHETVCHGCLKTGLKKLAAA